VRRLEQAQRAAVPLVLPQAIRWLKFALALPPRVPTLQAQLGQEQHPSPAPQLSAVVQPRQAQPTWALQQQEPPQEPQAAEQRPALPPASSAQPWPRRPSHLCLPWPLLPRQPRRRPLPGGACGLSPQLPR
jgi:hypothetical protein